MGEIGLTHSQCSPGAATPVRIAGMSAEAAASYQIGGPRLAARKGVRYSAGSINVDGNGLWGNPFNVARSAAAPLVAATSLVPARTQRAQNAYLHWASAVLYSHWIAGALDALPTDEIWDRAHDDLEAWPQMAPTIQQIATLKNKTIVSRGPVWLDHHGDVLRAVAVGWDPLTTIASTPYSPGGYRHYEKLHIAFRSGKRSKLNLRVKSGWSPW